MRPPQLSTAATFEPFLAAAAGAGVTQIVFLSLQGAERNKVVPHAGIEKRVAASGIGAVFLRASFFMENLTTTHASDIRDRDEIAVPAGRGATSFIAGDDIAAVAARALLEGTVDDAWTLTGPSAGPDTRPGWPSSWPPSTRRHDWASPAPSPTTSHGSSATRRPRSPSSPPPTATSGSAPLRLRV